ncbi:hypothetical protein FD723_40450 (plasmid) [Nostoc sp. C052]|uniref:hypothetical protein n=1 Tax=Nostoc sp. C052 TaxID=2576902 RepID=UPI0015C3BF19|nr:hypothetical protein [Nostoc sp. C052]QLE46485.1 hypothetical protein FD723_40450 [Nostoc sp. C052]
MLNRYTSQEGIRFAIKDTKLFTNPSFGYHTTIVAYDGEGKKILSLSAKEYADAVYFDIVFCGETPNGTTGFALLSLKNKCQEVFDRILVFDFQDFDSCLNEVYPTSVFKQRTAIGRTSTRFSSANDFAKNVFKMNCYLPLNGRIRWENSWVEENEDYVPRWSMSFFVLIPSLALKGSCNLSEMYKN